MERENESDRSKIDAQKNNLCGKNTSFKLFLLNNPDEHVHPIFL